MKYYVKFKVEGRYTAEVEADSVEEAKEKAKLVVFDADFGVIEDVDYEPISVEDENDNFVWEKD